MSSGKYIGPPIDVTRFCEHCTKPHSGTYRTGRFCSRKCGIGHRVAAAQPPEVREKVRVTQQRMYDEGKRWGITAQDSEVCSKATTAWLKKKWQDPEYRYRMRKVAKSRWEGVPAEERTAMMKKVRAARRSKHEGQHTNPI